MAEHSLKADSEIIHMGIQDRRKHLGNLGLFLFIKYSFLEQIIFGTKLFSYYFNSRDKANRQWKLTI